MPHSLIVFVTCIAFAPLVLLLGTLGDPQGLATLGHMFSGALLLLALLQGLRFQQTHDLCPLSQSLVAGLVSVLVLGDLLPSVTMSTALQAGVLSILLLLGQALPAPACTKNDHVDDSAPASPPSEERNIHFLSRLSHEMRTSLNGVLGMTELLTTTPLSPRQREYVKTLQGAGNDLLQRINELFDISALANGELELEHVPFNLPELVTQATGHFLTTSGHPQERLKVQLPQALPESCEGDPARLSQLLHDLLGNAQRRCGHRGVIELKLGYQHGKLVLRVCDDGPVVDSQERQRLLATPFTQSNYLRARMENRQPGLLRSQRLTSLMGGHFTLECPDEGGMCAHLSLPLDLVSSPDNPLQLSDARVLVVDPCDESRELLGNHCRSWGMQVTECESDSLALALLRSQQEVGAPFDVLLVDQDLARPGALELARSIRSDSRLPDDTVLILCGNGPGSMAARQAGFDRLIGRPVASYTLRATLDEEMARLFSARRHRSRHLPQLQIPGDCQVLVAEDDEVSARVIHGMLSRLNIGLKVVNNGRQALDELQQQHWDLVLMDCDMPVMDGLTATRLQREREAREGLTRQPIIALSAHVMDSQRERMRAAGMDDLLGKPVDLGKLYQILEHWLPAGS